jgi:hypothetical protein
MFWETSFQLLVAASPRYFSALCAAADPPVSAGFATVHGNNSLTINAVEAYPLDKFSAEVGDNIEGGI